MRPGINNDAVVSEAAAAELTLEDTCAVDDTAAWGDDDGAGSEYLFDVVLESCTEEDVRVPFLSGWFGFVFLEVGVLGFAAIQFNAWGINVRLAPLYNVFPVVTWVSALWIPKSRKVAAETFTAATQKAVIIAMNSERTCFVFLIIYISFNYKPVINRNRKEQELKTGLFHLDAV